MGNHASHDDSADDVRDVMDHVRRIVQALRVGSRAAEAEVGLSAAQLFVLSRLADTPALSVNDLAARTATHQSSVSVVVSKLVQLGLLRRSRSKADARVAEISITTKGRSALRRAPSSIQDALMNGLKTLRPADRKRLAALLGTWLHEAGFDVEPPPMFFERKSPTTQRKVSRHVQTRP